MPAIRSVTVVDVSAAVTPHGVMNPAEAARIASHAVGVKPEWLNVVQAAKLLSLTPRAVLHRITSGKIKASKLGEGRTSAYVIAASEIERIQQAS